MDEATTAKTFAPIECGQHPLSAFAVVSLTIDNQQVSSFIHYWYIRLCQLLGQEVQEAKLTLSPFHLYHEVMNHVLPAYYARSSSQPDGNFVGTTINVTKSMLRKFLLARFEDDSVRNHLALLKNGIIVECSADRLFGVSRSYAQLQRWLHYTVHSDLDAAIASHFTHLAIPWFDSSSQWFGANLNGVVLMELRRELLPVGTDVGSSTAGIFPTVDVAITAVAAEEDASNAADIDASSSSTTLDKFSAMWKERSHSSFYCHDMVFQLDLLPLQNSFAPLAVSYEMPILAGETLYPSAEHYVAAQYFRDVQRLEAARNVASISSRFKLRAFIAEMTSDVPSEQVQHWRENRMYSALKAAMELKFAQYPELKDLLLLTGVRTLLEVDPGDSDWSIGMSWMTLQNWMVIEKVNPLMLLFWFLHPDHKPGIVGLNHGGRLLMEMRQGLIEEKNYGRKSTANEWESLICPICCTQTVEGAPSLPWTEEIVILHRMNPLAFTYPNVIIIDGEIYLSVEHYVKQKLLERFDFVDDDDTEELDVNRAAAPDGDCQSSDPFSGSADFLWNRNVGVRYQERSVWPKKEKLREWIGRHGLELYERALKAKFLQNQFCRELLINTGDALLVEIRGSDTNHAKTGRFEWEAMRYGAFVGSCEDFIRWVEKNRLTARLLSTSWQSGAEVVRLPRLGKNMLGLLLMKVRFMLRNQEALKQASTFDTVQLPSNLGIIPLPLQKLKDCFGLLYEEGFSLVDCHFSPLSPHYVAPFRIDEITFLTVEHFLWYSLFVGHVPDHQKHSRFIKCILECRNTHRLPQLVHAYVAKKLDREVTNELKIFADLELQSLYEVGMRAKFAQNENLLPALFANFQIPFYVSDSKSNDRTVPTKAPGAQFKSKLALEGWIKKWRFSLKNVLYWWLHPLFKPTGFAVNAAGIALMVVRSERIRQQATAATGALPDAPSHDRCNAFEGLSNFTVSPVRMFVFDSSHPFSPTFIAPFRVFNDEFPSVVHFYWSRCLKALGAEQEFSYALSLAPDRCNVECQKVAAKHPDEFLQWQNNEMKNVMLTALRLKFDRAETLRRMLLATESMLLVYGDDDGVLGIGMAPPQLDTFCTEVGVDACLLKMWLCNGEDCAACIGQNFCGLCLMELRQQLCEQPSAVDPRAAASSTFISPKNIVSLETNRKDEMPKLYCRFQVLPERTLLKDVLYPWTWKFMEVVDEEERSTTAENICDGAYDDVYSKASRTNESSTSFNEAEAAAVPQAYVTHRELLDAFDSNLSSICDLLSEMKSEAEAIELGRKMAHKCKEAFGGELLNFAELQEEDVYNLGRVAGFLSNSGTLETG